MWVDVDSVVVVRFKLKLSASKETQFYFSLFSCCQRASLVPFKKSNRSILTLEMHGIFTLANAMAVHWIIIRKIAIALHAKQLKFMIYSPPTNGGVSDERKREKKKINFLADKMTSNRRRHFFTSLITIFCLPLSCCKLNRSHECNSELELRVGRDLWLPQTVRRHRRVTLFNYVIERNDKLLSVYGKREHLSLKLN